MCQNLLPFVASEIRKYGLSGRYLRMKLLGIGQKQTFCSAQGVIFLTEYVRELILQKINLVPEENRIVIPHGANQIFSISSRKYSELKNILYVSTVDEYKHQIEVVKAVSLLRKEGLGDLKIWFIGGAYRPYLDKLQRTMQEIDPEQEFVFYLGEIDHKQLKELYFKADLFVFASSCETFGISLLEAMTAALPIACSDRGPMPEILRDAGTYFNPEQPASIAASLKLLIQDEVFRKTLGHRARSLSQEYSWERCAQDTFSFLQSVYQRHFT
jgi:glycosyltransferase involved in cell wall biosynthesis